MDVIRESCCYSFFSILHTNIVSAYLLEIFSDIKVFLFCIDEVMISVEMFIPRKNFEGNSLVAFEEKLNYALY